MSEIDCGNHSLIATCYFGTYVLPVYYTHESYNDFTENCIYIGGGSGEHPALEFKQSNLDLIVRKALCNFAYNICDMTEESNTRLEHDADILDATLQPEYKYPVSFSDFINQRDWDFNVWLEVHKASLYKNKRVYEPYDAMCMAMATFLITCCSNLLSAEVVAFVEKWHTVLDICYYRGIVFVKTNQYDQIYTGTVCVTTGNLEFV